MLVLDDVLKLFLEDPQKELTIRQISKELGVAYGHVYNKMREFINERIFLAKRVGRAKLCSLNLLNSTLPTKLADISGRISKELLAKDTLTRRLLEEFLARIQEETNFNLYAVVLFGSYAKGLAREKSDIDLLILTSSKEKFDDIIHQECGSIEMRYGRNVSPVIMMPQMYLDMMKSPGENVGKQALRDKIILSGGEKYWQLTLEAMR